MDDAGVFGASGRARAVDIAAAGGASGDVGCRGGDLPLDGS